VRKPVSAFAAALIILIFFPAAAAAHFFIDDGDIKALVHVDPEHQPVTGEMTTINYELSRTGVPLQDANYDAFVKVDDNGIEVSPSPARLTREKNVLKATIIFVRPGNYRISLIAVDKSKRYRSFRLIFNQWVEGNQVIGDTAGGSWIRLAIYGSLIGWIIIAFVDMISMRMKNNASRENE